MPHARLEHAHERLDAYRVSREFAVELYHLTASFPREERYGLVAQIRRAAVSIPANIAEGAARRSTADFARFVAMARGSLNELEVLLWVSEATGIVSTDSRKVVQEKLDRLFAMTSGLIHRADRKRPVHR